MNTISMLWVLLDFDQRKRAILLLILMFFGMVLEALSLGLIIPVLGILANPNDAVNYMFMERFFKVDSINAINLVIGMMILLVTLYFFKVFFLAFLSWYQARFVFDIESRLSSQLYSGYLQQSYMFHMQHNSALLVRNVITSVGQLAASVMSGSILLTELFILVGVLGLLILIEPIGAIAVTGIIFLFGFAYHRLTRQHISSWGRARQYHEGQRLKSLQQGFGGVREIKLSGQECSLIADYENHNLANAHVGKCQAVITALPRLWLELLFLIAIFCLIIAMIGQGRSLAEIIPILGVFVAAAFRLMPSANKIINAIQNLNFNLPVIHELYKEKALFDKSKVFFLKKKECDYLQFNKEISVENVSFIYPDQINPILTNISFKIRKGEMIGFMGVSGSGKSTLINLLLGLLEPTSGRVLVDGIKISDHLSTWYKMIGYVPQNVFLLDDTLIRNIAFGLPDSEINEIDIINALKEAQLLDFVDSLPDGLETKVGERGVRLSGGQAQRIGIARALYHKTQVLVFDEATSALDAETEMAIISTISSLSKDRTILIITHRLSTVVSCNKIYKVTANGLILT
jgi:ABC-type multidrug transport system fused ATPase/permease subunit